jgi:hypothetical protein
VLSFEPRKFWRSATPKDSATDACGLILLSRMFGRVQKHSTFIVFFFLAVSIFESLPASQGVEVKIFRQPLPVHTARIRGGEGKREGREQRHKERRSGVSDVDTLQHEGTSMGAASQGLDHEIEHQEHDQLSGHHDEGYDPRSNAGQATEYHEEAPPAEEEEERFGYFKKAEREMRKAEEAEAERSRLHEEYMERRRRGELPPSTEEVRDTLRWGDDSRGNYHRDAAHDRSSNHNRESSVQRDVHEHHAFPEDMTVPQWLESLGLGQYAQSFMDEGWDSMNSVLSMSQEDLIDLGVKRGHVRKMLLALGREVGNSRASIAPSVSDRYREASYGRGRPEPSLARWVSPMCCLLFCYGSMLRFYRQTCRVS